MKRRFGVVLVVSMLIAGPLVFSEATASAAGPYLPPNPGPVRVEAGVYEFGVFPLPGLYLGPTSPGAPPLISLGDLELVELIAEGLPNTSDPIVAPPSLNGEPDSYIALAIKDHDPNNVFVGVATFRLRFCGENADTGAETACATYDFDLYVGVDLPVVEAPVTEEVPAAGAETGALTAAGAVSLLLGGGLVVAARRRRHLQIQVR